jgi:nuclear pore complex protein Nup188
VNLFYAVAINSPSSKQSNPAIEKILQFFTTHGLNLLQQLNYASTHPNHLASCCIGYIGYPAMSSVH